MVDPFGRTIDYLRLSITDRCNLRCRYCMPPEGVHWLPHSEVLRFEETLRLCRILAGLGISVIRVTGGEPLVRRGAVDFINELGAIEGVKQVSLTTNGVLLAENLPALTAGLNTVNISLDTMDGERFRWLTGSDKLANVLFAIDRALELGLAVKVNCVPLRGCNEDDIAKLAALAKNKNMAVRFIELMPLGEAASLQPIPEDEVISLIERAHGPVQLSAAKLGSGPAVYYTLPDFAGQVGLISPLSRCFCQSCNRLRLTVTGLLKPCLASDKGLDLAGLLRNGTPDDEIAGAILELVAKKPAGHGFGLAEKKREHDTTAMFRIGG